MKVLQLYKFPIVDAQSFFKQIHLQIVDEHIEWIKAFLQIPYRATAIHSTCLLERLVDELKIDQIKNEYQDIYNILSNKFEITMYPMFNFYSLRMNVDYSLNVDIECKIEHESNDTKDFHFIINY